LLAAAAAEEVEEESVTIGRGQGTCIISDQTGQVIMDRTCGEVELVEK